MMGAFDSTGQPFNIHHFRHRHQEPLPVSGVAHSVEQFDNHLGLHIEVQRKTSDLW